jgi:hypothetical protein
MFCMHSCYEKLNIFTHWSNIIQYILNSVLIRFYENLGEVCEFESFMILQILISTLNKKNIDFVRKIINCLVVIFLVC